MRLSRGQMISVSQASTCFVHTGISYFRIGFTDENCDASLILILQQIILTFLTKTFKCLLFDVLKLYKDVPFCGLFFIIHRSVLGEPSQFQNTSISWKVFLFYFFYYFLPSLCFFELYGISIGCLLDHQDSTFHSYFLAVSLFALLSERNLEFIFQSFR